MKLKIEERTININLLLLILIVFSLIIRIPFLNFNSAYMDEANYMNNGTLLLKGELTTNPLETTFSSYIPLVMLGFGNILGGLIGGRTVVLILSVVIIILGYRISMAVVQDRLIAFYVSMLFSIFGSFWYISTYATYDIITMFFLAIFFWLHLKIINSEEDYPSYLCILSSISLVCAVLSQYIVICLLPIVFLEVLLLKRKKYFIILSLVVIGCLSLYTIISFKNLTFLYKNQILGVHKSRVSLYVIAKLCLQYCNVFFLPIIYFIVEYITKKNRNIYYCLFGFMFILVHIILKDDISLYKHVSIFMFFQIPALAIAARDIFSLKFMEKAKYILVIAVIIALIPGGYYWRKSFGGGWPNTDNLVNIIKYKIQVNTTNNPIDITSEDPCVLDYYLYNEIKKGKVRVYKIWYDFNKDGKWGDMDDLTYMTQNQICDLIYANKMIFPYHIQHIEKELNEKYNLIYSGDRQQLWEKKGN